MATQLQLSAARPAQSPQPSSAAGALGAAADPAQLCEQLRSEQMVVQAAQGLLDALRSAQPQSLGAILSAVRESDATAELLKLAASLAPAEEREVGWELLGQICRAASLQSLPPVDVGTFVKTVQTTLRVTLWKYSHELMCTEGTLNAAALRASSFRRTSVCTPSAASAEAVSAVRASAISPW